MGTESRESTNTGQGGSWLFAAAKTWLVGSSVKHQGAFSHGPKNTEISCRSIGRAARDGEEGAMARDPNFL